MTLFTRRQLITTAALASAGVMIGCSSASAADSSSKSTSTPSSERTSSSKNRTEQLSTTNNNQKRTTMLFINPSCNPQGNTASMGADLLKDIEHETINLIDYKIYPLGSDFPDDQFKEVWEKLCNADFIVWGSPVYWHSLAAPLKTFIDRMYDYRDGELAGKNFAFFQQGGDPTQESLEMNAYIIGRIAALYEMNLVGISNSAREIPDLREAILEAL